MTILVLSRARNGGGKAGRRRLTPVLSCATCCFTLCTVVRKVVVTGSKLYFVQDCPSVVCVAGNPGHAEG